MRFSAGRFLLRLGLAASLAIGALAVAAPADAGPSLLLDMRTGKVLSQQDIFERWYPASLTKLMTVYVVFRAIAAGQITLNSPVTITSDAEREPPSKIGLPVGTVLTVDSALKILLVKSANDIATALAESVGGTEAAFVARMNEQAQRLGMFGTHFANPHGLQDPDHYTTARDLAVLALQLRNEFPQYAPYFSIEAIKLGKRVIHNYNPLIGQFDGADGMKTGFTCEAGYNLLATANRNGRELMAIVLGETSVDDRDIKTAGLLAKGFTEGGFDAPLLSSLKPSGAAQDEATDMHDKICTKEAREALVKERKSKGDEFARSPDLHKLDRPRHVVMISLVSGPPPSSHSAPGKAAPGVPIPTPRPDYPAAASAEGG